MKRTFYQNLILANCFIVTSLNVQAQLLCKDIFLGKNINSSIDESGVKKLRQIYPNIHQSIHLKRTTQKLKSEKGNLSSKPNIVVEKWLLNLTQLSKRMENSPWTFELVKKLIHKQYVINYESIPESYYAFQANLERERGYGDLKLSEMQKKQIANQLIIDQQESIDTWLNYLTSKDSSTYPMWMKFWIFMGMTKLGKFDIENGTFHERRKDTVGPFVELNQEALSKTYESVVKIFEQKDSNQSMDLSSFLNFGKIYGKFLREVRPGTERKFLTNKGQWRKFPKGSDPTPLVDSLKGKNTGWCTAGFATATAQLAKGDFYVFYSNDQNDQSVIPRVAIRMEGAKIGEIRGVASQQNLDPEINNSSVVSEKVKEIGADAEQFFKKDHDMKLLTIIEKKTKNFVPLNKNELMFLYEMASEIDGFGYKKDPRINLIKSMRDFKSDVSILLDQKYSRDQISISAEEALSGKFKIHFGDLDLPSIEHAEGIYLPEIVFGNVKINNLIDASNLVLSKIVYGNVELRSLESAKGVTFSDHVHGDLFLNSLSTTEDLFPPKILEGDYVLSSLPSGKGLLFPEKFKGLYLNSMVDPDGLSLPDVIYGNLSLNSLQSVHFKFSKTVMGFLNLESLSQPSSFPLAEEVHGDLILDNLTNPKIIRLPKKVKGSFYANKLIDAKGLVLTAIEYGISLPNLQNQDGLELPKSLKGDLDLRNLPTANNLILPMGTVNYYGPEDIHKEHH